jgi:hypothetical protein
MEGLLAFFETKSDKCPLLRFLEKGKAPEKAYFSIPDPDPMFGQPLTVHFCLPASSLLPTPNSKLHTPKLF